MAGPGRSNTPTSACACGEAAGTSPPPPPPGHHAHHHRRLRRLLSASGWPATASTLALRTLLTPTEVGALLRALLSAAYGATVAAPARHSGAGGPAVRLAIVTGGGRPLVGTVDRRGDARMEVRLRPRHGKGGGGWEAWVGGVWARLRVGVGEAEARLRATLCG